MTPTVGSLFSGIGGLDLGLERAGFNVRWQCEVDGYCARVLKKHWPDIPNLGDVTQVDWQEVERVDVICGGYPCQPFSLAGARRGTDDERHLWPYMRDAIRVLRPRAALLENVPGHLSLGFGTVLADLADSGYDTEWDCIPAAAVGAPHLRYRLFVIAYADREGEPGVTVDAPLEGNVVSYASNERCEWERRAREAPAFTKSEGSRSELADADRAAWGAAWRAGQAVFGPEALERLGRCRSSLGTQWSVEPDVGRVANGVPAVLDGVVIENAHEICFQESRAAGLPAYGEVRVMWDDGTAPAASSRPQRCVVCGDSLPVLPYGSGSAAWKVGSREPQAEGMQHLRTLLHGIQPLSGEELLAGVPSRSWTPERKKAVGSRVDRLRGLGNAVVPQVAEFIGEQLMAHIQAGAA